MSRIKTVGVIGGMGPGATIDFLAKVLEATPANGDQQHIPMIIDNNTQVPERGAAILLGHGDPGPVIARMALRLESMPVDFLVMPCNTAHFYAESILAAVDIPFISIIEATVSEVKRRQGLSVGLLATEACLAGGMYQRALEVESIGCIAPTKRVMTDLMTVIGRVKQGDQGEEVRALARDCCAEMVDRGAELLIAGCTEIPLVVGRSDIEVDLVSSTEELAKETVALAVGGSAEWLERNPALRSST